MTALELLAVLEAVLLGFALAGWRRALNGWIRSLNRERAGIEARKRAALIMPPYVN